jgi:23S rRNA (uracil1939-C5)-methyltransferase
MSRVGKSFETEISDFHISGPGIGVVEEREMMVWGALPGERVVAEVRKKKKRMLHALVTEVLDPSPDRIEPLEEHYLSCSPWQVLNFKSEVRHKIALAQKAYIDGGIELPSALEMAHGAKTTGYRNKMEFSFTRDNNELSLALFRRLGKWRIPLPGCVLATDDLNAGAQQVLEGLRRIKTSERILKTMIIRANRAGKVNAALFLKDKESAPEARALMGGPLDGLQIWYSEPRTMASRPTELLSSEGGDVFEETLSIDGKNFVALSSHVLGFFQINPEVFEMVLKDMAPYIKGEPVVEFFAGVGAITLGVSAGGNGPSSAVMVEIEGDAVNYAKQNIKRNGLEGKVQVHASVARKMRDEISSEKVVIFDPPRAGLDPRTVRQLQEVRPKRIVYLSCNVETQARDISELLPHYRVEFARLYNFFPRTPHIEGLLVLERI